MVLSFLGMTGTVHSLYETVSFPHFLDVEWVVFMTPRYVDAGHASREAAGAAA